MAWRGHTRVHVYHKQIKLCEINNLLYYYFLLAHAFRSALKNFVIAETYSERYFCMCPTCGESRHTLQCTSRGPPDSRALPPSPRVRMSFSLALT